MFHRYRINKPGLNQSLLAGYQQHENNDAIRRSHYFHGRYENIYLTSKDIPELEELIRLMREHAVQILGREDLRYGLWFNHMPPGAVTTRHNHDNEDELLSGVYYVTVPVNSGDLVIYDKNEAQHVTPCVGDLFFFSPRLDHEVTRNNSDQPRLSIAINFGPAE